jgi:hypothetical protein
MTPLKRILDVDPLNNARPIGILIVLRGTKSFPPRQHRSKYKGAKGTDALLELKGAHCCRHTCSRRDLEHLGY